jgi:hypothetical protein
MWIALSNGWEPDRIKVEEEKAGQCAHSALSEQVMPLLLPSATDMRLQLLQLFNMDSHQ